MASIFCLTNIAVICKLNKKECKLSFKCTDLTFFRSSPLPAMNLKDNGLSFSYDNNNTVAYSSCYNRYLTLEAEKHKLMMTCICQNKNSVHNARMWVCPLTITHKIANASVFLWQQKSRATVDNSKSYSYSLYIALIRTQGCL